MEKQAKATLNKATLNKEKKFPVTMFFHSVLTTPKDKKYKNRRVTLAGVLHKDGQIKIGTALCSLKDNFERKKGRLIALGRANKKPLAIDTIKRPDYPGSEFIIICKNIINTL